MLLLSAFKEPMLGAGAPHGSNEAEGFLRMELAGTEAPLDRTVPLGTCAPDAPDSRLGLLKKLCGGGAPAALVRHARVRGTKGVFIEDADRGCQSVSSQR